MPARLGQHFLANPRAAKTAVEALALRKGDLLIEIGPGRGELTFPLREAAQRAGAKLAIIERDRHIAAELRALLHDADVKIIEGDAVRELPELLASARGRVKIAGNIPYYITGKLLRILGEASHPPERAVIMTQKEVAERIVARAPKFNLLAAAIQVWAKPQIIAVLPPRDFRPPPRVESALLLLLRHPNLPSNREHYERTMKIAFRQPRKTLLNNLREGDGLSRADAAAVVQQLALPETARPHDLTVEKLLQLAQLRGRRPSTPLAFHNGDGIY